MLFILTRTLKHLHEGFYDAQDSYIYSKGNASEDVREEIVRQLKKFQEGYTKRDTSQVQSFMHHLFSEENVLVLGTMPQEICIGQKKAAWLVFSDWKGWGDCTFLMENANISSHENVAWFSTIGYVKFDMSRWLVLPLRLTGVMVNENNIWKFQQMQFQFDLDLSFLLGSVIIMIIWSAISVAVLVVVIVQSVRKSKKPVSTQQI